MPGQISGTSRLQDGGAAVGEPDDLDSLYPDLMPAELEAVRLFGYRVRDAEERESGPGLATVTGEELAAGRVSRTARDMIVTFDVTSRANYERNLIHPIWPGGRSGITITIGDD
jgi:hypothetical protein